MFEEPDSRKQMLKSIGIYLMIVLPIVLLGIAACRVISSVQQLDQSVIDITMDGIQDDPGEARHLGHFFSTADGNQFAIYDENGEIIVGEPNCAIMASSGQVTLENETFEFSISNCDLNAYLMSTLAMTGITIGVLAVYVEKIITMNRSTVIKWDAARTLLGQDTYGEIANLNLDCNLLKKINLKMCVTLSLVVSIACSIICAFTVQMYGMRITDRLSGTIHHYGVIHSEDTIQQIRELDNIEVDIYDVDYWPVYSSTVVLLNEMDKSNLDGQNGYLTEGMLGKNYKLLDCGRVICITIDLSSFYTVILTHIGTLVVFLIYLVVKVRENASIRLA